jgi:hypothetical protein
VHFDALTVHIEFHMNLRLSVLKLRYRGVGTTLKYMYSVLSPHGNCERLIDTLPI